MQNFQVTIKGKSPLLMHWDNIEFAEQVKTWQQDPENKKYQVKGDDRSPAFAWLGYLYNDGAHVAMPGDNIMRCMMEGGASVEVPGGKRGKTFKAQSQSGMSVEDEFWKLYVDGRQISMDPFKTLSNEKDFKLHQKAAVDNGFTLFVKRARIGTNKHVRVRPRFDRWELRGIFNVWDDQITKDVLCKFLDMSGRYKGLGDWRPSSKTPGPYGRFDFDLKEV